MNGVTDRPDGAPLDSGELGAATRSCLAILIILATMLALVCVTLAVRWLV